MPKHESLSEQLSRLTPGAWKHGIVLSRFGTLIVITDHDHRFLGLALDTGRDVIASTIYDWQISPKRRTVAL